MDKITTKIMNKSDRDIIEYEEYVVDIDGNKCYYHYFGSRKSAKAALRTLVCCRGCVNCINCHSCKGCGECHSCIKCTGCSSCVNCNSCTSCIDCRSCLKIRKCSNALIQGPIRSDGYQFVMSKSGSVHAGCRVFSSVKQARKHWKETRVGTKLGDETMRILSFMAKEFKERKG